MERSRILIIDDDLNLGKTLADILRGKGYEAEAAASGAEGLASFDRAPSNLVLIDLQLPDMPGIEVLERIKASRPATEAIILTGNASLETAIEATNKGAFSYLLKPYEIEQLLQKAKQAMERQQAGEKIERRSRELQRSNLVLKALHQVSRVLSRSIDMETLLREVLLTFAEIEIFHFEKQGAAFLVEEGRLRMVASIGLSGDRLEECRGIRFGQCLCGTAASTGEIIISGNSLKDPRHLPGKASLPAHGHVVLPLKSVNDVVGVLCIFARPGLEVKGWELRLFATLGSQIGIAVNNARLYEEARSDSLQDPLTGLGNRRSMQIQIEKSVDTAGRYGSKLSVIMMDIDHFKEYNDTHGHQAGDGLLVRLADIFLHELRRTDYIYRYGGEEFLVILPETGLEKAVDAAERMRAEVESQTEVTISLGVASCLPAPSDSACLIGSADAALYRAKQNGRNRVEMAE
ncbi:MAG TPA: diguanylate cyclase [Geobacteraceae bacterium]